MDLPSATLIGAHGYCTQVWRGGEAPGGEHVLQTGTVLIRFIPPYLQELVNLLVCGRAVPNVFDNDVELDSGHGNVTLLKGIKSRCDVGLLSLFEHYNICKVRTESWETPPPTTARFATSGGFLCVCTYFSCLGFQVGAHLKTPRYPIWLLCSESHFSVLFGLQRELLTGQDQFDLYYYDGLANQQEEIRLTVCESAAVMLISAASPREGR